MRFQPEPAGRGARLLRRLAVWLLAALLVCSAGGRAVGWAMERVLASTVDATVGEPGRFDLLVQVQQDRRREATAALGELLRREFPGASVQQGPSAAGSSALLVSLTPRWRGAAAFQRLGQALPSLPGFVSWVPLVEPSVVVARLHPAVQEELERWLRRRPEVAFWFDRGQERVVVLQDAAALDGFQAALQRWLDGFRVVRVATPGHPADREAARLAAQAVRAAGWALEVVDASPVSQGAGADAARWVGRLRDFFFAYATLARITPDPALHPPLQEGEPVTVGPLPARVVGRDGSRWLAVLTEDPGTSGRQPAPGQRLPVTRPSGQPVGDAVVDGGQARIEAALQQSEELLGRLESLGAGGQEALAAAREALDRLQEAAARIEQVLDEVERLSATATDPVRDTLVALGLSLLLGRPAGQDARPAAAYVQELRGQLERLQAELDGYRQAELPRVREQVQALRESLPRLSGDEVASALQVLQQAGVDPLTAPAGVELVLQGRRLPPAEAVGRVVRQALGLEQGRVYAAPVAVASPSARAAVMGVARRAASAGAALATAGLVLWTLLNDWAASAALIQAARRGRAGPPGAVARLTTLTGALAGTALGLGAAALALGPGEPLVLAVLAAAGAAGGAAAGRWGPRLSPVDADAVEAALAAGLEAGAVLEAVVAPSARPWLLAWTAARRPPKPPAAAPVRRPGPPAPALCVRPVSAPEPPPPEPAGPVLEAEGLVRRFGRQTVLDGVSLALARGETVVLMGPSGCGKSTLLRCLKGLVQPDAGTVRIDGHDLWALPASRRRALAARVGMVFQRPQLVPHLSVLENAALGAAASGVPWAEAYERAAAWLAALELGHHLDRRPAELSGGEGQRVAIARALAAAPEIVLWDEPTAHLDPMLAADLLQLMEELIRRLRTTMLVVTHQPGFTARVGDRLILMEHGRVVESGPPARVLAQPASEVGRRLARLAAV